MGKVVIQVLKNGPYLVNGEIELKDADGKIIAIKKDVNALCRCGGSCTKPFCDGAHVAAGFQG
ncbi:MAG: CDGSH iron-sulfur domain-containing protein [Candidatus Omnitrophica bacterium]|nr:CDGSH iron-sulfur domain-containing protein [Candidatus Omnitrophota bacterium]